MKINDLLLFQMIEHAITQFKRWHHMTQSYAEHMALGQFYEGLGALEDELLEVYIGIFGRQANIDFQMKFQKYSKGISTSYLKQFNQKMHQVKDQIEYGCIQNIIDGITALTNKTIYLLTLS